MSSKTGMRRPVALERSERPRDNGTYDNSIARIARPATSLSESPFRLRPHAYGLRCVTLRQLSTTGSLPTYAVITPVRDESKHFRRTAHSLLDQQYRPIQWVIVDDGSTDGTRAIADSFAAAHTWITVIDSGSNHDRARGAPIVRAFELGRSLLRELPDVTVKLDGDVYVPPHYFRWVAQTFARDPRAGIVGGVALVHDGRRWVEDDRIGRHSVNGVAKAYRVECLDDIGGLRRSMGWDNIDEHGARARGWKIYVLSELHILHYKRRGSKQRWYRARWEEGVGAHYMAYLPSFLMARTAYRMVVERPPVVGGMVLGAGFLWSRLAGRPQIDDQLARASIQIEQRKRLRALLQARVVAKTSIPPAGGPAMWVDETGDEDR